MDKLFYTVGEVADILNESTSLVRFWANEFPKFIRPQRNAKGNRLFSKDDVNNFRKIHHLVKTEGLTLEGAARRMKEEKKGGMDKQKVLDTLQGIRQQLAQTLQFFRIGSLTGKPGGKVGTGAVDHQTVCLIGGAVPELAGKISGI